SPYTPLFRSWERNLRESPESASYTGDDRYNDRWTDMSLEAIAAREAADREALAQLRAIDRDALPTGDQLSYDVFLWQAERAVERQQYKEWLQPVSQRGGVQTAEEMTQVLSFQDAGDYRDWLARMRALPTVIAQVQALMEAGIEAGNLPPRVLMERVPGQVAAQLVDDPVESPFYRVFTQFPRDFPETEKASLQAEARAVILGSIVPTYRDFAAFFQDRNLRATRDTIAVADLPQGRAYYDFLAGYFTTTDLTADQFHDIGLREVARIWSEMELARA